ncbi:iron-sulfur cluster assembly scaffold protein [Thalassobaculum sp. OXR-137]|uniref:iron-sulfur cluster assembly scaffold protein n=1 Tax=Thalassobaculum sp. OXR-137 TaxID=3100173 RepID=UPI002AC97B87|nr:iron-sulfur cluster assembly scaffold protein [Thalassobaculum sp. OXR-137]WPZ34923.1 iron-sulfur cluster assembly scaffold protein [Thalassobaculum sp. OXR-137]
MAAQPPAPTSPSLDSVYQDRLLDLAETIARDGYVVAAPDAETGAVSRACGSRVTIQVRFDGDTVAEYGQRVEACALGSAAASAVGGAVVGASVAEVRAAATALENMLKRDGPAPGGRFEALSALLPAKAFTNRHASILLTFRALEKAFKATGR